MAVHFEIETTRIDVGTKGGYFTVRGLNTDDVTFLTVHYLEDIQKAVAKHGSKGVLPRSQVADLVMDLARDFPSMTLEIISRAAEATSKEETEALRRMSFIKQMEALKAIAVLTVEDGGVELGKLFGVVASLLEANGLKLGPLTKSLQTIIGTSEKQSPV